VRISRTVSIALAITATAMAVAVAGAVTRTARAQGTAATAPGAMSFSTPGELTGVAAASAGNAWAVGYAGTGVEPRTLMLHWNGRAWTRVTSPEVVDGAAGMISAVTVVSADDAWAVGSTGLAPAPQRTLILHWNGTSWREVTSPAPFAGMLSGVTASAGAGWAVGSTDAAYGEPLILRWNGAAWSRVAAPADPAGAGLNGVIVTSAATAWASGLGNARYQISGVLARWNGQAWQWASFPVEGTYHDLSALAAGPGGTAFAVGYDAGPGAIALSMRWTGQAWQKTAVSTPRDAGLSGVAFAPDGGAWAVGYAPTPAGFRTLIARWTGRTWTRVASPSPGASDQLSAVAFCAPGDGWAVGYTGSVASTTQKTLIVHWNGKTWS
jgi:hypothetical protein